MEGAPDCKMPGIDAPLSAQDIQRVRLYKRWAMSAADFDRGITDAELVKALCDPDSEKSRALRLVLEHSEECERKGGELGGVGLAEWAAEIRRRYRLFCTAGPAMRETIEEEYRQYRDDEELRLAYMSVQRAKRNDYISRHGGAPLEIVPREGEADDSDGAGDVFSLRYDTR